MNLLANLATLITAIATFVVVWEMRLQRRSSYAPALSIADGSFDFRLPSADGASDTDESVFRPIGIEVANVGNGPARDITAQWAFDVDEFVAQLQELDENGDYNFAQDYFFSITHRSLTGISSAHNVALQSRVFVRHIAPLQFKNAPDLWQLPPCYIALVKCWLHLMQPHFTDPNRNGLALDEFPSLVLNISYRDLIDDVHRVEYRITLEVVALTFGPNVEVSGCVAVNRLT